MLRRVLRCAAIVVLAACATLVAHAHQQKAAVTSVTWNPRAESIEVVHRFYLHDAEHAMQTLHATGESMLANEAMQAQFADYVASHFTLAKADAAPLALNLVGYETERVYIYVYQEAPGVVLNGETITLGFSALHDIWTDQSNLVNVELGPCVQSVVFDGRSLTSQLALTKFACLKNQSKTER